MLSHSKDNFGKQSKSLRDMEYALKMPLGLAPGFGWSIACHTPAILTITVMYYYLPLYTITHGVTRIGNHAQET